MSLKKVIKVKVKSCSKHKIYNLKFKKKSVMYFIVPSKSYIHNTETIMSQQKTA